MKPPALLLFWFLIVVTAVIVDLFILTGVFK